MTRELVHRERTPHGEIVLWLEDDRLSLWFDDVILQSEIHLRDPAVLPNPANRAMLAHLMFGQEPRSILLAGGGGGAIGRWFHARRPESRGDAVELDPQVIRIAREYFDYPHPTATGTCMNRTCANSSTTPGTGTTSSWSTSKRRSIPLRG